jgi:hypothetical protein
MNALAYADVASHSHFSQGQNPILNIIVTKHAIKRLKERFGLQFGNNLSHPIMAKNLIIAQVSNAEWLHEWKMSPFLFNKTASECGHTHTELLRKSHVIYICEYTNGTLLVKTCVKHMFWY